MKNTLSTLIIDDEPQVRGFLREVLQTEGWEVTEAASAGEAFQKINEKKWVMVFCDVILGDTDGYEVLRRFNEVQPETKVILMTGYESAAGALEATSIGAFDYLVKPFSIDNILTISTAIRKQMAANRKIKSENNKETIGYTSKINLIGRSPKFVECLKKVGRVAPTNLPVLITGESGTGKEVVARAIHSLSDRADKPFVPVNCGAIPVDLIESELFGHKRGSFTGADRERIGLWEEADGGTIFLDEITETQPRFQVKILRVLQQSEIRRVGTNHTKKVDVRVIAATNRDIEKQVAEGDFREDLMYRLNAITIDLPPLRERLDDIPVFTEHFVNQVRPQNTSSVRFSDEVMEIFMQYKWQGNVRELENTIFHAVSMSDGMVHTEHLPSRILKSFKEVSDKPSELRSENLPPDTIEKKEWLSLSDYQNLYVKKVLTHTDGNKQAAARLLDIDRKTLYRMIKRSDK